MKEVNFLVSHSLHCFFSTKSSASKRPYVTVRKFSRKLSSKPLRAWSVTSMRKVIPKRPSIKRPSMSICALNCGAWSMPCFLPNRSSWEKFYIKKWFSLGRR